MLDVTLIYGFIKDYNCASTPSSYYRSFIIWMDYRMIHELLEEIQEKYDNQVMRYEDMLEAKNREIRELHDLVVMWQKVHNDLINQKVHYLTPSTPGIFAYSGGLYYN
jgi:hypothetical protein